MMGNLVRASFVLESGGRIYITTEELLIDFRELIGEHSGENMAEAVWATLELYSLIGRVSFLSQCTNAFSNANMFTDHCYRNGQCQQQQYIDGIIGVAVPTTGRSIFSARCSHAMHASYNTFGSDQGMHSWFLIVVGHV
jgi:hypothetical protein